MTWIACLLGLLLALPGCVAEQDREDLRDIEISVEESADDITANAEEIAYRNERASRERVEDEIELKQEQWDDGVDQADSEVDAIEQDAEALEQEMLSTLRTNARGESSNEPVERRVEVLYSQLEDVQNDLAALELEEPADTTERNDLERQLDILERDWDEMSDES